MERTSEHARSAPPTVTVTPPDLTLQLPRNQLVMNLAGINSARKSSFEASLTRVAQAEKSVMEKGRLCGYQPAAFSEDEIVRLKRLHDLKILDTPPEEGFDRLVELASLVFDCPISLVSLVDEDRQWFKAEVGLGTHETGRDVSFCAHSFAKVDEVFLVPDANQDPRFAKNPLVTSKPDIGFYAGAPLVTTDGYPIGTLCVIDHKARDDISPKQLKVLQALAKQVMTEIELRVALAQARELKNSIELLLGNTLPPGIAVRMLREPRICDEVPDCTCVFVDLVSFTAFSATKAASEVVANLDSLFTAFDEAVLGVGVCKIKTIGDGYFFAAGVPELQEDHAARAARAALRLLALIEPHNRLHDTSFSARIGLCSGPAVAGVVGSIRFQYDLWGATVNLASRVEQACLPGRATCCPRTAALLAGEPGLRVTFAREAHLKGIGLTELWEIEAIELDE